MVTQEQIDYWAYWIRNVSYPIGTSVIIVGRTEIVLVTLHNERFINAFKYSYPPNVRSWDPDRGVWTLTSTNENLFTVHALLHKTYGVRPLKVAESGISAERVVDKTYQVIKDTLYTILKIEEDASPQDIKKAYKQQALLHHPDKKGEHETFLLITHAYNTLSDPVKKAKYDAAQKFLAQAEAKARSGYQWWAPSTPYIYQTVRVQRP